MEILSKVKFVLAVVGGLVTSALGGWDLALRVLIGFVVADYVTGLAAAWYECKLNSDVGLRGVAKKILLFVPVALGHWLDQIVGGEVLRSLAVWFYLANEGLSIIESLGRMGIPIPEVLLNALEQLQKRGDTGETLS